MKGQVVGDFQKGRTMRGFYKHCNGACLCRMAFSGMLCRVALVRTDVSEEFSASIIRVTRIGELGMLAIAFHRRPTVPSLITFRL
jgi:hypothetical protein